MGQNYCNRCDRRHNTPVGRNCPRKVRQQSQFIITPAMELADDRSQVGGSTEHQNIIHEVDSEVTIKSAPAAEATASLENRMNSLESLLTKLSENLLSTDDTDKPRHRHRSPSASTSGSDCEIHVTLYIKIHLFTFVIAIY